MKTIKSNSIFFTLSVPSVDKQTICYNQLQLIFQHELIFPKERFGNIKRALITLKKAFFEVRKNVFAFWCNYKHSSKLTLSSNFASCVKKKEESSGSSGKYILILPSDTPIWYSHLYETLNCCVCPFVLYKKYCKWLLYV